MIPFISHYNVSVRLVDVTISKNPIIRDTQKRTMKVFLSHFSSLMKERILVDNQSVVKPPVSVRMKPPVSVRMKHSIYYHLLRKAPPEMSLKEEIFYVLRLNQLWRERLRYITSITNSTDKRLLINLYNKYRQNFDITSPYRSTGNTLFNQILIRFKKNILLSGFKCLDTGDFLIKNVLSKREAFSSKQDSLTSAVIFCIMFSTIVLMEISPEPLLNKPDVFFSEYFSDVLKYVRDTYVNHVCTNHKTPSPCECGEPINRIVREMIPETTYDFAPLGQLNQPGRLKTITYMLGTILLLITLMDKTGGNNIYEIGNNIYDIQKAIDSINYR